MLSLFQMYATTDLHKGSQTPLYHLPSIIFIICNIHTKYACRMNTSPLRKSEKINEELLILLVERGYLLPSPTAFSLLPPPFFFLSLISPSFLHSPFLSPSRAPLFVLPSSFSPVSLNFPLLVYQTCQITVAIMIMNMLKF